MAVQVYGAVRVNTDSPYGKMYWGTAKIALTFNQVKQWRNNPHISFVKLTMGNRMAVYF